MTRKADGNERSVHLSTIKNVTGKLFMLPHEKHIQLYKIIIIYNSGNDIPVEKLMPERRRLAVPILRRHVREAVIFINPLKDAHKLDFLKKVILNISSKKQIMRKSIPRLPLHTNPAVGIMIRVILDIRLGFLINMFQTLIIDTQQLLRARRAEIQGFLVAKAIRITQRTTMQKRNLITISPLLTAMLDALIQKFRLVIDKIKGEVAARQMEDKFFTDRRVKPFLRIAFLRDLKAETTKKAQAGTRYIAANLRKDSVKNFRVLLLIRNIIVSGELHALKGEAEPVHAAVSLDTLSSEKIRNVDLRVHLQEAKNRVEARILKNDTHIVDQTGNLLFLQFCCVSFHVLFHFKSSRFNFIRCIY